MVTALHYILCCSERGTYRNARVFVKMAQKGCCADRQDADGETDRRKLELALSVPWCPRRMRLRTQRTEQRMERRLPSQPIPPMPFTPPFAVSGRGGARVMRCSSSTGVDALRAAAVLCDSACSARPGQARLGCGETQRGGA